MAILTDVAIQHAIREGFIEITPYNHDNLNPNSYDLTLHDELLVYTAKVLDLRRKDTFWQTKKIKIPERGLILRPGKCYLARTAEFTVTKGYTATLHGKSSNGRAFLEVVEGAGYVDNGYEGYLTICLKPHYPIRVYPGVKIAQISYNTLEGRQGTRYNGKYQHSADIVASKAYEDIEKINVKTYKKNNKLSKK